LRKKEIKLLYVKNKPYDFKISKQGHKIINKQIAYIIPKLKTDNWLFYYCNRKIEYF